LTMMSSRNLPENLETRDGAAASFEEVEY